MNYTDFLGNTVEVGDLVVYTPADHGNELVLAEVLQFKEKERMEWRKDEETGKYGYVPIAPTLFPVLQPIKSTNSWRGRVYVRETKKYEYAPMRRVTLGDCSGMIFHSKSDVEENTE